MNNPFKSLLLRLIIPRYYLSDSLYLKSSINIDTIDNNVYCFDFSDDTYIHLGDVLFYLPLIVFLSTNNNIFINVSGLKLIILKRLLLISNIKVNFINHNPSNVIIITSPYLLCNKKNLNKNFLIGLGLPKVIPDLPFPIYLSIKFLDKFYSHDYSESFNLSYKNYIFNLRKISFQSNNFSFVHNHDGRGVIFSPFLSSGRFRDFLGFKRRKLYKIANMLSNLGYTIYLVGSKNDTFLKNHNFVDLRGYDFNTLLDFSNSSNIIFGLGFDNFWMHYFDLFNKPYYVLFRGRFTKKARLIHYESVNVSFYSSNTRSYL